LFDPEFNQQAPLWWIVVFTPLEGLRTSNGVNEKLDESYILFAGHVKYFECDNSN
jgi:hypothetical protein